MNLTRKIYTTRREKIIDFAFGFGAILLINVLFSVLSFILIPLAERYPDVSVLFVFLTFLPWIINIGIIILAAFTRHWIAIGALAVPVLGFIITLCALLFVAVLCFANSSGLRGF